MNYETLATKETVEKVITELEKRGMKGEWVATGKEAFERIKKLIPAGASVMNGSSTTLNQIGFVDYLKAGEHTWNNLHAAILAEKDPEKQRILRRQSVVSDWYLGSSHAVTENGELLIASNSGSQLPHLVFTSQNIILVVGTQKIVPDMQEAMKRLREFVFPLEDARMKSVNMGGSFISKILMIEKEQPYLGRNFHIIFVNEKLGF